MEEKLLLAIANDVNRKASRKFREFLVENDFFSLKQLSDPEFSYPYGLGGTKDFIMTAIDRRLENGIIKALIEHGFISRDLKTVLVTEGWAEQGDTDGHEQQRSSKDPDNTSDSILGVDNTTNIEEAEKPEGSQTIKIQGNHNTVFQSHGNSKNNEQVLKNKWTLISLLGGIALILGLIVDSFGFWEIAGRLLGSQTASPTTFTSENGAPEGEEGVSVGDTPVPQSPLIVFTSNLGGDQEIYFWDQDTAAQAATSNLIDDMHPAISPDGTKLLYTSVVQGVWDIYLMDLANNAETQQLTSNSESNQMPVWSNDGTMIAFISNRRNGDWDIYKMSADGSGQTNLTYNSNADEISPTWSPTDREIAFASARDLNTLSWEIYTLVVDNPNQINRITNSIADDRNPSWSPIANIIAFETNRDSQDVDCTECNWNIYTINSDGSNLLKITTSLSTDTNACWSPNGDFLLFTTRRDGNLEIYKSTVDGKNQENITNRPTSDEDYCSWYQ